MNSTYHSAALCNISHLQTARYSNLQDTVTDVLKIQVLWDATVIGCQFPMF